MGYLSWPGPNEFSELWKACNANACCTWTTGGLIDISLQIRESFGGVGSYDGFCIRNMKTLGPGEVSLGPDEAFPRI
jgi:hypothetical protein